MNFHPHVLNARTGKAVPVERKRRLTMVPRIIEEAAPAPVKAKRLELIDIIDDGVFTITPEVASRILTEAVYEGQGTRHTKPAAIGHIRGFAELMRQGSFRGEANAIYFCSLDGVLYLVDGYHRVAAIVECGEPVSIRVVINDRDSMTEVARDYATYNRSTRARTAAQVRGAFPVFGDDTNCSKTLQAALEKSIPFILSGFDNTGVKFLPPEMKGDAFLAAAAQKWVGACELYQKAIDCRTYRAVNPRFHNPSLVGVAVIILRYQPEIGFKFWEGVLNNTGLAVEDPRRVLNESINSRNDTTVRQPRGMASMVATAWKKWLAGEAVQVFRVSATNDKPFTVARTEYKPSI